MADIKFLQNIDFTGVTSKNFVVESDSNPQVSGAVTGQILFDSGDSKLAYFDGSAWVTVPDGNTTYSWTLAGDSGSNAAIASGNTVDIAGGTGISTAITSTNGDKTATITNDKPFDKIIVSDGSNTSDILNNGTITFSGAGGVTVGESSGTVTITGPSGSMSSFTLAATTGSDQTVSDGETVSFSTGDGSTKATIGGTRTINFDVEYGPTSSGKNVISLAPTTTATVVDSDQLLIETDTGTQIDKHVNKISASLLKSYIVDGIATGMTFKGAYNASTPAGSPDLGSNDGSPGVALVLGDTYVVSAIGGTGQFYSEPIEIGDLIIVNTAHAAGATGVTSASFTIVNRNIDVATATTAGIASFPSSVFTIDTAGAVGLVDRLGSNSQSAGSANDIPSITVNQDGIVTALSSNSVTIPTAGKEMTTASAGGGTTTLQYKHNLNARVITQVYEMSGDPLGPVSVVYPNIKYVDLNQVNLEFASSQSATGFTVMFSPVVA